MRVLDTCHKPVIFVLYAQQIFAKKNFKEIFCGKLFARAEQPVKIFCFNYLPGKIFSEINFCSFTQFPPILTVKIFSTLQYCKVHVGRALKIILYKELHVIGVNSTFYLEFL